MVALDKDFKKFSENYLQMSDRELLEFRKEHVCYLFAGQVGSQDSEERNALIGLIDKEFERRYKKRTEAMSIIALIVSIISIAISIFR